jgi:hypothetical protein
MGFYLVGNLLESGEEIIMGFYGKFKLDQFYRNKLWEFL